MIDVSIKLFSIKKSGTLSRLIREIKLLGLEYKRHKIEFWGERCFIAIESSGDLSCNRETLLNLLQSLPEVRQVDQLHISQNGEEVTEQ